MSTRVDSAKNCTINLTGIILYPWYNPECIKVFLKQGYFEPVAEFQLTVVDCSKYLNVILCSPAKNELSQYPICSSSLIKNPFKICSPVNNLLILKDVKHGEINFYICFGTFWRGFGQQED